MWIVQSYSFLLVSIALPTENAPVIDVDLQKSSDEDEHSDDDDSDSSSSSESNSEEEAEEQKAESSEPTIQIQFTMGNMEGNPMMKLLQDEDNSSGSDDSNASDDNDDNEHVSGKKRAIQNLLSESTDRPSKKPSKPLITEL